MKLTSALLGIGALGVLFDSSPDPLPTTQGNGDLRRAEVEARESGKPLLALFR